MFSPLLLQRLTPANICPFLQLLSIIIVTPNIYFRMIVVRVVFLSNVRAEHEQACMRLELA